MEQQYRTGEGPQALVDGSPLTIVGAELDSWLSEERFANTPRLCITLSREFDYPALRFKHKGGYWYAEKDGFVMAHYHTRSPEQQDGYGGRHFPIVMEDGEEVVLKGPWHSNTADFYRVTGMQLVECITRTAEEAKKGPGRGYSFGWWATIPRVMEALALIEVPNKLFQTHLLIDKGGNHNFALIKGMNRRSQVFRTDWLYYDHMRPKDE